MKKDNKWAKVAVIPLTLLSGLLLLIFSWGRADTIEQVYIGIFNTWLILSTTCAFTTYAWLRLFLSRKHSLWPTLLVGLLVGSAYTTKEIIVMRHRLKTAEENRLLREIQVEHGPAGDAVPLRGPRP